MTPRCLQVDHLCRYLLDLSLCDIHFVEHLASRKAAASIYVARRIVLHAEELKDDESTIAWTRTLQFYRFDLRSVKVNSYFSSGIMLVVMLA